MLIFLLVIQKTGFCQRDLHLQRENIRQLKYSQSVTNACMSDQLITIPIKKSVFNIARFIRACFIKEPSASLKALTPVFIENPSHMEIMSFDTKSYQPGR